jgi:leucyl aminopeptidase
MTDVLVTQSDRAVPIHAIQEGELAAALDAAPPIARALASVQEFKAKAGQVLVAPDADGAVERVLFGLGAADALDPMSFRALPSKLPGGDYRIAQAPESLARDLAALAFALGSYRFDRYKKKPAERPRLVVDAAEADEALLQSHACAMARDMVNTPANDMGPLQIETIAREVAEQFRARITVIVGEGLLEANYPAVHAVGRAAVPERAPRMIEIDWGKPKDPLVALVGKGVVFDTGGLDIKPSAGMRLMKKDMGGAAHILALARMIMAAKLPVRLAVLIPVVENAISGDAMRPGDVLDSRKGLTIEVGNTDAEGRLILADALARAAEMEPALTIDMATLTGAARAALGPQLPPYYTDDETLAAELEAAARRVADPMWRMPLWKGYADALDSDIADLKNDPDGWAQAGSVTAALFLQRFAPPGPWLHFDIMSWNPRGRPGWPQGAEVQGARALFQMIRGRFS